MIPKPIAKLEAIPAAPIPEPAAEKERPRLRPMFCRWLELREDARGTYWKEIEDGKLYRDIMRLCSTDAFYERRYPAVRRLMDSTLQFAEDRKNSPVRVDVSQVTINKTGE